MIHENNQVPVPLPLEIPPPPNLSHLPAHILHSGTVETLIGQNEDLMARLKVNVRRNSILEQQIMEQDRVTQEITRAHNSLVAQLQVFEEKGEIWKEKSEEWKEKSQAALAQSDVLNEKIELMEARVEATEERNNELRAGIEFERAYRRRIRSWVRPFINSLKLKLGDEKKRNHFLDRQLETREATIGDLRERLNVVTIQMQNAQRSQSQDQALLVEKYEIALRKAEAAANEARAAAENRIIYLERKNSEIEQALSGEISDIQVELANFRKEAKRLASEMMASTQERDAMKQERDETRAENLRLQDQFESLQTVWAEAQKKFEASRLQQDSLNKLNQELSRQLKADRKAREAGAIASATSDLNPADAADDSKPVSQSLDRIDSLLAVLEAGFTKARGSEAQINGLEFLDEKKAEARTSSPGPIEQNL